MTDPSGSRTQTLGLTSIPPRMTWVMNGAYLCSNMITDMSFATVPGRSVLFNLELLELGVDPDLAHEVLHVPDHAGAGGTRAVGNLEDLPP